MTSYFLPVLIATENGNQNEFTMQQNEAKRESLHTALSTEVGAGHSVLCVCVRACAAAGGWGGVGSVSLCMIHHVINRVVGCIAIGCVFDREGTVSSAAAAYNTASSRFCHKQPNRQRSGYRYPMFCPANRSTVSQSTVSQSTVSHWHPLSAHSQPMSAIVSPHAPSDKPVF